MCFHNSESTGTKQMIIMDSITPSVSLLWTGMPMKGKILILSSSRWPPDLMQFDEQAKSFPEKIGDFHCFHPHTHATKGYVSTMKGWRDWVRCSRVGWRHRRSWVRRKFGFDCDSMTKTRIRYWILVLQYYYCNIYKIKIFVSRCEMLKWFFTGWGNCSLDRSNGYNAICWITYVFHNVDYSLPGLSQFPTRA